MKVNCFVSLIRRKLKQLHVRNAGFQILFIISDGYTTSLDILALDFV